VHISEIEDIANQFTYDSPTKDEIKPDAESKIQIEPSESISKFSDDTTEKPSQNQSQQVSD